MTDIVERLRKVAERADANYPTIMEQAADEIERLREEVAWHIADKDAMHSRKLDQNQIDREKSSFCCFCGKHQDFVEKLVQSKKSSICNECIDIASDMVRGKSK